MASRSELEEGVAGLVQSPFADGQSSEYAQRITTVLKRHYKHGSTKMLAVARKIATPAQRQALPKRESEGGHGAPALRKPLE